MPGIGEQFTVQGSGGSGGGGGLASVGVGSAGVLTGGTSNSILFEGAQGVVTESTFFRFYTPQQLAIIGGTSVPSASWDIIGSSSQVGLRVRQSTGGGNLVNLVDNSTTLLAIFTTMFAALGTTSNTMTMTLGLNTTAPAAPFHLNSTLNGEIVRFSQLGGTSAAQFLTFFNSAGVRRGFLGYTGANNDQFGLTNETGFLSLQNGAGPVIINSATAPSAELDLIGSSNLTAFRIRQSTGALSQFILLVDNTTATFAAFTTQGLIVSSSAAGGFKIAGDTSQAIGFFGAGPVTRQGGYVAMTLGGNTGANTNTVATFSSGVGTVATSVLNDALVSFVNRLNSIETALSNLGLTT